MIGLALIASVFRDESDRTWANGVAFGGLSFGIIRELAFVYTKKRKQNKKSKSVSSNRLETHRIIIRKKTETRNLLFITIYLATEVIEGFTYLLININCEL